LEIIGGISAVFQILQTALDISERLRAAGDKKGLARTVERNHRELKSVRDVVAAVEKEEALQTLPVLEEIDRINELVTKTLDLLRTIEDANFVSRLSHGKDRNRELSDLAGDIGKAKINLNMKIQQTHVGLTRLASKQLAVQMKTLEKVEHSVGTLIDQFDGFFITQVVEGKPTNGKQFLNSGVVRK
jgi:hypothetical protein